MDALPAEYVAARPHRALAPHVAGYGYGGYREFSATPLRRRQAPTGSCTLLLGFGPPIRLYGPAGPFVPGADPAAGGPAPVSFLTGVHTAHVVTEFTGPQHGLQVDLTPLGALTLLGRPLAELTDRAAGLDELDVPALAALPERLAEKPDWRARFALLDAALLGLLERSRLRPDPEVAWTWEQLVRTGGAATVADLAAGTGWSPRHLRTRFRTQIGLAPKTAARVLRFRRAADLLAPYSASTGGPCGPTGRRVADVAAACGYADHAHLVREFRALAGCTPTHYVNEASSETFNPDPVASS